MIKRFITAMVAVAAVLGMQACGSDDDKFDETLAFRDALQTVKPGLTSVKWEKKGQWRVAEGREGQYDVDVWFDTEANWKMTETDYNRDVNMLPAAIVSAIAASEYQGRTIDDIECYERADMIFYVVELEAAGQKDVYAYYKNDGTLLKTSTVDEEVTPLLSFLTPAGK